MENNKDNVGTLTENELILVRVHSTVLDWSLATGNTGRSTEREDWLGQNSYKEAYGLVDAGILTAEELKEITCLSDYEGYKNLTPDRAKEIIRDISEKYTKEFLQTFGRQSLIESLGKYTHAFDKPKEMER